MYAVMAENMAASVAGAGPPSGPAAQGWMIPFMSRYSASNSTPEGLGRDQSTLPGSPSVGDSSNTLTMHLGYFSESQRKNAGTPIQGGGLGG